MNWTALDGLRICIIVMLVCYCCAAVCAFMAGYYAMIKIHEPKEPVEVLISRNGILYIRVGEKVVLQVTGAEIRIGDRRRLDNHGNIS